MEHNNTNRGQSVGAVVIKDGKVLLVRHTYGAGQGKLVIPGGYVELNETPQNAVIRELLEETGVSVEPLNIISIRFNIHDWYVVFTARYLSGEAISDQDENSEAIWMELHEAVSREDVPDLTKKLLSAVMQKNNALKPTPYEGNSTHSPYSLYL